MAALVHVHGTQSKAKDIEFTSLAWALSIAFSINQLFIVTAFSLHFKSWSHASVIVINHAFWTNW